MTDPIDMSWSELVELGKEQQQRIEQLESAIKEAQRFADAVGPADALLAEVRRILWAALPAHVLTEDFAQLAKAEQRIEQLEALLRHARCPNKDCIDGAYPFGPDRELCECEWCDERKAVLAEDRE